MDAIESSGLIEYDRMIGSNRLRASIELTIEPLAPTSDLSSNSSCVALFEPVIRIGNNAREFLGVSDEANIDELKAQSELARSIILGCQGALKRGVLASFSLANVICTVTRVEAPGGPASLLSMPGSLRAAASYAVMETLNQHRSSCSFLEPTMSIEITIPVTMVGAVVSDLASRRGTIGNVIMGDLKVTDGNALVMGEVPLAEILGYANNLRSLTGGEGAFSAEYKGHSLCNACK
jgi:elongation factor G